MIDSQIRSSQKLIIDRINQGRCIPFLGPGVNISSRGYQGLPLPSEIADKLVKEIEFMGRDPKSLAQVALHYQFLNDRSTLIQYLKSIIPDDTHCGPSPLHKIIAKLPFKLIITTNYDRLMEKALDDAKIKYKSIVQPVEGFENNTDTHRLINELIDFDGCILYKIYGSFNGHYKYDNLDRQQISEIIVTEDDYIKFLTIITKQEDKIGIPRPISSKLAYSTLLFLGYSLQDWDFRTIYNGLIESLPKHHAQRLFAIQKDPSEFWAAFWQKKGVNIYNIDPYDFGNFLMSYYEKEFGQFAK